MCFFQTRVWSCASAAVVLLVSVGAEPLRGQGFAPPHGDPPPGAPPTDLIAPNAWPPPPPPANYAPVPAPTDSWVETAPAKWPVESSLQLGLNGSEGNAQAFSLRAGGDFKYDAGADVWKADFTYAKTNAKSIVTQHNGLFNLGYEHLFSSPWTMFVRFGTEWDEFKAFDVRLFLNAGAGYRFIDTNTTKLKGRLGAGWSREINGPRDYFVPEAVLGVDFEQRLSDRQKFTFTSDYFPNWNDFADYRVVSNLGWEVLLDEATRTSLKLSVIDRYDNTPEGRQPNDLDYALLLLWKL